MTERGVATAPGQQARVTIITQTRVRAEDAASFARWQEEIGKVVAGFPGFINQSVTPPSPPEQVDWVILQRFATAGDAVRWLNSRERLSRLEEVQPKLVGHDDIHLVSDGPSGALPAPVSVVISTRIKPGQDTAYRRWEQRIAAAQAKAQGFQGYRFEPPIPGVQNNWLAILRFDSEANLKAWLDSPERHQLLEEAAPFTEEFHARIAKTGFDQWFSLGVAQSSSPPAWKQNMLVLLMLYPVVFLFGVFVQAPLLSGRARLPFAITLFIGNVASVILLNWLVPWTSRGFKWWLQPGGEAARKINLAGAALVIALYALSVFVFTRYF
jgi:antibiotic biosynthesis monooxygenase (ABM) superfamily enzyme